MLFTGYTDIFPTHPLHQCGTYFHHCHLSHRYIYMNRVRLQNADSRGQLDTPSLSCAPCVIICSRVDRPLGSPPADPPPKAPSRVFDRRLNLRSVAVSNLRAMEFRTLCLLGALVLTAARLADASQTIYDVLKQNGLPVGLLPKAVKSYSLGDDGSFEVSLTKPCYAKFESQVYYETTIKGILSYGQIAELSGVQAQELFLWFPVKGIRVDVPSSGFIYFDVGVIYKQYSLSLFETPPDCKDKGDYLPSKALQ